MPAGEEAGPKLVRLLCFVGVGFLLQLYARLRSTKWRELEQKSILQQQQKETKEWYEEEYVGFEPEDWIWKFRHH